MTHQLKANPVPWLLEPDLTNPGIRYFALRDLLDRPGDDPQVVVLRWSRTPSGPVSTSC